MSDYLATVAWSRNGETFIDNRYSRGHVWKFDGGAEVPASASPHVVPLPMSIEANVDPEEAFVAALSSCHMLFFLHLAAGRKFVVDEYVDNAVGIMEKNEQGKTAITRVTLRPKVRFAGERTPTEQEIEDLHHRSHELCFIANSVITRIDTEIS